MRSRLANCVRENRNQDLVIKGSFDFKGGSVFAVNHHPNKFRDNRYCDESDLMFLICHMISHNLLPKYSCDFMIGSPSPYVITLMTSAVVVKEVKHFRFIR